MLIKPEILAPAGSMDALKAAVYSGADAVYLGGSRFGARAFAGNFEENELLEGIYFAHLYGVKVYLTINTLFRNDEIKELYKYIKPYYDAGLDAVIVQDFGVMEMIFMCFPGLSIHASTQMSITTPYSYELLKDYGVTRIVPARELSIREIINLKNKDFENEYNYPELEIFVQGALCYCYSGHCLMSSFIGGRSGNRGRCAQSCRLPYSLYDSEGNQLATDGEFLLSPRDLCGLEALPELIKASVDSLKIEGRMKKPEYVAACVGAYRRCVDHLVDSDINSFEKYRLLVDECKEEMASVFNRGGFTSGYYHRKNGKNMMSMKAPGHLGLLIGEIISVNKNRISVKLKKDVNPGDIFVIRDVIPEITLTCNTLELAGNIIELNVPRSKELNNKMKLFRMLDIKLENRLSEYERCLRKIPVCGQAVFQIGKKAVLKLTSGGITIECEGLTVEKATSLPVCADTIHDKLCQTGNTSFGFDSLAIIADEDIFYPMKALKQLKREAFKLLENTIIDSYKRRESFNLKINQLINDGHNYGFEKKYSYHIIVSSREQLSVIDSYNIDMNNMKISLDLQYFNKSDIMDIINEKQIGLVLPMIFRNAAIEELDDLPLEKFDSITVRNIDELGYLKAKGYHGDIIADYSLYSMNDAAVHFYRNIFHNISITIPVELNEAQIKDLNCFDEQSELIVYNYQPLMVTAQCMQENSSECNAGNSSFKLKDRTDRYFYVKSICKYCYSIIYNGIPTVLSDDVSITGNSNIIKKIQLSIEDGKATKRIIETFVNNSEHFKDEHTRGHFKRGVS